MGAVAKAVTGAVSGVVEAAGDVVEGVGDVVKDVGKAIDDYVIEPIKNDPLTAIASIAAAAYLGPMAAAYFGTSAAVGTGLAVAGANTAAGLVQGESFDEAIKGGAMAGLTAGVTHAAFGPTPGSTDASYVNGSDVASDQAFANSSLPPVSDAVPTVPGGVNPDVPGGVSPDAPVTPTAEPLPTQTAAPTPATPAPVTPSPLESLNQPAPTVDMPTYGVENFKPDYNLGSNLKPDYGIQSRGFSPADSFDMYGDPNYSVVPKDLGGGPGMQPSGAPSLARMGGGTGLTADVYGMPAYTENGVPTTWTGENGQVYGNATPDVTISSSGIRTTPTPINYGSENMGTMSTWDKAMSGDLTGVGKDLGTSAWNYAKENPWTTAGGVLLADQVLNKPEIPTGPPQEKGGTRNERFNKPLDLYAYMRDRNNYQGDLTKYGQTGQGGEQNFFQNTRFEPIPITPAAMGGLIQMKRYAQGGPVMQGGEMSPQQMMQQNPAGGRPVPPQGGRPPMMPPRGQMPPGGPQGGLQQGMPPRGPQGGPQQGQRPQMQNRNPKTAYYQYGTPPVQAKAMGGLSQVNSMKIGGGADGRSDDVNAVLSDGEYVFDAETVAMLGNGSSKAGANRLDNMRENVRQHKGQALASGKISPDAKSPLAYLKGA
jgi:hypothetical protein